MRTTLMAGVCALVLSACSGDGDAEEPVTEAAIDARMPEAAAPEPVDPMADATAYLEENAARDGVRVTESGLQIETLQEGEGRNPTAEDVLRVNYEVRTSDGQVLDSSQAFGQPVVIPSYEQMVLPGLIEAVPQMKVGERSVITMPPSLAFGEGGIPNGPVGPGEVIVFDLELVEAIAQDDEERLGELRAAEEARMAEQQAAMRAQMEAVAAENRTASEAFLAEKSAEDGVEATESGLLYKPVDDSGDGPSPAATDTVRVHYRGTLPSGETFDSSYDRGEPAEFPLDGVIAGWTEGLQLMNVGDTYEFYIPSDLAYGDMGRPGAIPPAQALVFQVELLAVNPGEDG